MNQRKLKKSKQQQQQMLKVPASLAARDMSEHEFELDGWTRWDMPSEDCTLSLSLSLSLSYHEIFKAYPCLERMEAPKFTNSHIHIF